MLYLNGREVLQQYGSSNLMTVADIANYVNANGGGGGGGGGYSSSVFVSTGTTGPVAALSSFVGWQSNTPGPKTQPVPASTGSLKIISVGDGTGNAGTYPITFTPASGNVVNGLNQVNSDGDTGTWVDTPAGWWRKS